MSNPSDNEGDGGDKAADSNPSDEGHKGEERADLGSSLEVRHDLMPSGEMTKGAQEVLSGEAVAIVEVNQNSPWKKISSVDSHTAVEVIGGVATIQIPEEIFDNGELLWKSYVVGYFIGDAPHVGSIHATVNRIWSSPKAGTKIDVQFIEKNTVLFRVDDSQMRARVLQRKYWHIADIPLVVNEWSPETAAHPPDLTAMPLWVDFRGVPNALFSHKGLKCLTRAVGKYVKLHPTTEKCTRLDVARVLVEVNLQEPLVEKIVFKDKQNQQREIGISFPWLPPRCTVCNKWGHKGVDCRDTNVRILQKQIGDKEGSEFADVPPPVSGNGGFVDLLKELEKLPTKAFEAAVREEEIVSNVVSKDSGDQESGKGDDTLMIRLSEPTTDGFPANGEGWLAVSGNSNAALAGGKGEAATAQYKEAEVVGSPSRFSPLIGIEEEAEENLDETEGELEEGELKEEQEISRTRRAAKGRRSTTTQGTKSSKKKIIHAKDLKFGGGQFQTKKSSVRKI